jgi:hypothetical protein
MNKKTLIVLLVVVLLAGGWTYQTARRVRWEYGAANVDTVPRVGILHSQLEATLKNWGDDGWELVSTEQFSRDGFGYTRLYFKRQK